MPVRAIGALSFVGEETNLIDDGGPGLIDTTMIIHRNGRTGSGLSSRAGLTVYDTVDFKQPGDLTLDKVMQFIRERVPLDYDVNRRYYNGDHWQNGAGWSGPMPSKLDPTYAIVLSQVRKAFRSTNKIKEVVRRHTLAVVGKEPAWYFIDRKQARTARPTVGSVRRDRSRIG